jgi:hypothetical protein
VLWRFLRVRVASGSGQRPVRTGSRQLRPAAGHSPEAAGIEVLAAPEAFTNLDALDVLEQIVTARFVHNDRLIDALRQLASRLVGILHGCLKARTSLRRGHSLGASENLPLSSAAA